MRFLTIVDSMSEKSESICHMNDKITLYSIHIEIFTVKFYIKGIHFFFPEYPEKENFRTDAVDR